MRTIDRDQLNQRLAEDGPAVVEVLDEKYYRKFHLPGAINVPLDADFDKHIQNQVPEKSLPVVVYCLNADCEASRKAGGRMEELGYEHVLDYKAGKMDWEEAGLPVEQ